MAYHHQYSADISLDFRSQHYICLTCLKNVSVDHSLILGLENCTCADARVSIRRSDHMDEIQDIPFQYSPASNASFREESVGSPTYGVEMVSKEPETVPGNRFLPLVPALGLGELQHRRRAEFDVIEEELSYSLRRYIFSQQALDQRFHRQPCQNDDTWLRQDLFLLRPSSRATGGSPATHSRSHSLRSVSLKSNASGWMSLELDPVFSAGGWMMDEDQPELTMIIDEDEEDGEGHATHPTTLQDREEHEGLIAQCNLSLSLKSSELGDKKGRLPSLIGNLKLIL